MKIFTAIYVSLVYVLVTFCDSSNDDLSVCEIQDPARDVGFVRIGRYRKEFLYPSIYISIQSGSKAGHEKCSIKYPL